MGQQSSRIGHWIFLFTVLTSHSTTTRPRSAWDCGTIPVAAVGIYGILAHVVAQRSHELGIRMALGADRGNVRTLVMREGVVTALAGVLVGVTGSLAGMRLLESLLLPRTAADPWLWVLVPLFVVLAALVPSFVPSTRAARTDPVVALRGV